MAKKNYNNFSATVRLTKDARFVEATNPEKTNAQLFFTGACNEGFTGKDGKEAVSFIEFRLNGKRAEGLKPYLKKGVQLLVTKSRLRTWTSQKQDGSYEHRYIIDVEELEFIGNGHANTAGESKEEGKEIELDLAYDDLPF